MPVLVKILLSLALIMLVHRFSGNLLAALLGGMILLSFWVGHTIVSFTTMLADCYCSKNSVDNYLLLLVVVQVIWFSSQLSKTGVMSDITKTVTTLFSRRTAMALLPALIGLLPMPGGALFSAPLVDDCDSRQNIEPLLKTKINFWFRHIWEYWWPLYPGVILAIDLTGIEPLLYMAAQLPLSFFSLLIGYVFFLRRIPVGKKKTGGRYTDLLFPLLPVGIIVVVYLTVYFLFPPVSALSRYLPMTIAIASAMILQQILRPLSVANWLDILKERKSFMMALVVAVIRTYGAVIEAPLPDGGCLIALLRSEIAGAGVSALLLTIILPFTVSLTSGLAVGFVGASFPIVMQLIDPHATTSQIAATAVLAFGSGYVALLLSPVHVCLIVTNEHFRTELPSSIRGMVLPAAVLFCGIGLWAFLIGELF